jgi:hypothetical protein
MTPRHAKAPKTKDPTSPVKTCTIRSLPAAKIVKAAATAAMHNPANRPPAAAMGLVAKSMVKRAPLALAVMTAKYWGAGGVTLTVGFLDNPEAALRNRILEHMNAWARTANVTFIASNTDPQVRISFGRPGYWSYLGTDIEHIPANQPTMNLQGFTMATPDTEFYRVVRHETGHTLGFPHEHMRGALVKRLDERKCIAYFGRTQGWSPDEVRRQVLTPLADASIIGSDEADDTSIMCYQIGGDLTVDGQPIPGGNDINANDAAFAARLYPRPKR